MVYSKTIMILYVVLVCIALFVVTVIWNNSYTLMKEKQEKIQNF